MNRDALKEIRSFGFSDEDLRRDFHISAQTLINYDLKKLRRSSKETRTSVPAIKLEMLCFVLKTMKSLFPGVNPKIELRLLKVENETIVEFVNSHSTPKQDTDLLRKFLRLCIESQLKEKTIERAEERFRKKYEFINEDTLAMAAQELPELVEALVVDDKLTPLARANALLALSYTHNEDYLSLIKAFISYESPLMRESAFMGLFEYYDRDDEEHLELKDLFKKMLETEKAPGVKQRIALLLEDM